jgi:hypothetical protein
MKRCRTHLKWPKIPTTAIVIPAKYVYVSPTNTEEGYLTNIKKNIDVTSIHRKNSTRIT